MQVLQQISFEETSVLNEVIASLSKRAKHPLSLNQLLQSWNYFAAQVERGYSDSIYEYTNDLSVRDILEEVLCSSPPSLREKLFRIIQPSDKRFENATRRIERPLLSNTIQKPISSWWFRIPKNLSEELENDLKSEGVVE